MLKTQHFQFPAHVAPRVADASDDLQRVGVGRSLGSGVYLPHPSARAREQALLSGGWRSQVKANVSGEARPEDPGNSLHCSQLCEGSEPGTRCDVEGGAIIWPWSA